MNSNILIAFATKYGSTREVAEVIATTLRAHGNHVEVAEAADVDDVDRYATVVIGGALYMGKWHHDAHAFLQRHHAALTHLPLAVFAMGPKTLADADVASARAQLDRALAKFPDLDPDEVAIFGGVVDPGKLGFPFKHMAGSDARDWDVIDAWASEVAALAAHSAKKVPA